MSHSAFVFSFLLANSLIFCIQGFLFPPSMAGGCSCPPAQCPSAPTAHCIWKRQAGGEDDENAMVSLVEEEGEPERIDDGGDAGGSAGGQAAFGDGAIGQENPQMEGGDEDGMAMVYDDDLASSAAITEKSTVTLAQKQSSNTLPPENSDRIGERTLGSTIQTSSPILSSSSDSTSLNTSTTTAIPIGIFPQTNGEQSIEEKGKGKQEKVPLTKGKGKVGAAAKIVPEKSAGNNSGGGQTSTKNGATSRNCNSELMRQIMLEHINLKPTIAKRQIQAQVSAQIGGRIDVVCAKKAFSYIVNSELFCEVEKDGTVCLCYRQQ